MNEQQLAAVKQALDDLIVEYYMETSSFAKRVDEIFKQALAATVQEPVATLEDLEQEIYENTRQFVSCDVMEWMLKRYYTTPPAPPVQGPVSEDRSRVLFERHWRKTRGPKKSDRELTRHRLQPQTYIQDSANRHWVTWQAALKAAPPAAQPAVQREHITDGRQCWCNPDIDYVDPETGAAVIVHKEPQ